MTHTHTAAHPWRVPQELAWNLVTILILLYAAQYLPVDVTFVLVLVTLLFGPILINLFFGILKYSRWASTRDLLDVACCASRELM